jgi:hypothetical protein
MVQKILEALLVMNCGSPFVTVDDAFKNVSYRYKNIMHRPQYNRK